MATQEQTAKQIWDYLISKGWTKESVAALLGNMQSESGIIADRWESDIIGNLRGGYGLVQWTPASKYIDWATANGLIYQEVISQCKRLEWEVQNEQQFSHPTITFKQFTESQQTPEVLADIFIRYYERPGNPNQPIRQTQARYWYDKFKETVIINKEEFLMWAFYQANSSTPIRWFNGQHAYPIANSEEQKAINRIYQANTGKNVPFLTDWNDQAPYYNRLSAVLERKADF